MKHTPKDFTLEEKFRLLAGKDAWHTEDLGGKLYEVTVSDGPLGVRKPAEKDGKEYDLPSIAYPSAEVLSQTWSPSLAYTVGECLSDDCIEKDVDILLAPGVNIKRTPMCGRNFEYFSEDPYLAGVFAREYIRGVQSGHIGTSLKHFCANNREYGRLWVSSEVDERTLREIYLKPFEIACEADPATVMCSYNLVNGMRMAEHAPLFKLLRGEFWREDGVIISDWGAVRDRAASVRAGLDLEMPFSESGLENLRAAYARGEITEEEIDRCVERVLALIERCEREKPLRAVRRTKEERLAAAQRVAEEGIVLLKNNGILPLKDGCSVSIGAEHAFRYYSGGGSSRVQTETTPRTLCETLKAELPHSDISAAGVWDGDTFRDAYRNARFRDAAIVVCGYEDSEGDDRASMRLRENEERLILETARCNPNTIVVLHYGAAVDAGPWIDQVAAVVSAGYAGERGNEALAGVLSGRVNPSGKLTETFALSRESYASEHAYRSYRVSLYEEGLKVGYRDFDRRKEAVRFPFGFGLSYSKFEFSDLKIQTWGGVTLSFKIKNVSGRAGAEVAQIYIRETDSPVFRPEKELKAFEKVTLAAGEEKTVTVELSRDAFAYYSVSEGGWRVRGGAYEILVGADAEDIRLRGVATL